MGERLSGNANWKNRIVGYGEDAPENLLPNSRNYRRHPKAQRQALESVLGEVGYVQAVIVNKRTNTLVDGHLRCESAIHCGQPKVPIVYVDLSEEEEMAVLASLDPITEMATIDEDAHQALLAELRVRAPGLQKMIDEMRGKAEEGGAAAGVDEGPVPASWQVVIDCESESQQAALLARLTDEGLECRRAP